MNTQLSPFMSDLGNNNVITAQLTVGQLMLLQFAAKMMDHRARAALSKVAQEELDSMIDMFQSTIDRDNVGDIAPDEIQGYCL